MAGYGLIELQRGDRGRLKPRVVHDRVELDLPLTGGTVPAPRRKAG